MLIGGGGWRSRAARHLFPASLRESGIDVGAVKNRKRALNDAISGQDFAVSNVGIADGGLFEMDVADLVSGKGAFFSCHEEKWQLRMGARSVAKGDRWPLIPDQNKWKSENGRTAQLIETEKGPRWRFVVSIFGNLSQK